MGFLRKVLGTERPPEVQEAVAELEARLPAGWRFADFREQKFCRHPVKLLAYGASVRGPDSERVLAVAAGGDARDAGVAAVRALHDAVEGRADRSRTWAPPVIAPRDGSRFRRELDPPETDQERAARAEALALLPEGASPMDVDPERFDDVEVYAVVVQMPEGHGVAGVGLTTVEAWGALAARLRGELAGTAVWVPALDERSPYGPYAE